MSFRLPFDPEQLARQAAERASTWAARHGRVAGWTVAATLGGGGAIAFAVAPLAPDAASLPTQIVTESVPVADLSGQLESLAAHRLELSRTEVSRAGESPETLLRRLGVLDPEALKLARSHVALKKAIDGRPGRLVSVRLDVQGQLGEVVVRRPLERHETSRTHFQRVTLQRQGASWTSTIEEAPLVSETRLASGEIRTSLFAATDEARLPDAIAQQLADIFSADIDFHRQLRRGDTFSLVYESLSADGSPVPWGQGAGRVLAAEFIAAGRTHQAIWFETSAGKGAWFDPSGKSRKRAFLASPLEFSRITSTFAMRMHPILMRMRAHVGVDYAAPTGTPVRTVGEGLVEFAGWQGGYGNVVHVRHGGDRTTVYAHLSRIDVKPGQRVEQGQRIGAVGATGWATGPHLHFEFRVRGVHQDPLKLARAAEEIVLDTASRSRFSEIARAVQGKLDVAETLGTSRPRFE